MGRLVTGLLLLALLVGGCGDGDEDGGPYTMACAASLRRVVPDLLAAWVGQGGAGTLQATYAGSGTLRQQVEAGAPLCGVILAGAPDVDRLVELGRVDGESRRVVARNVLVLVGAAGAPAATFRTLADLPRDARVAIGDPRSVPAGRYAQGELERLGVWEALRDRIVPAADVSGVTTWVRRGDVTLGIAYATEVLDVSGLVVLDRADHPDAPAALVVGGACRGARGAEVFGGFLRFLASEGARSVWTRHGFLPP